VNIFDLHSIIFIDKVKKIAVVQPGIPMDALVKHLLQQICMPAVVPEFPSITAGGAFAGTAVEGSSFGYGYFDKNVSSMEMVLGNGDIMQASPTENADLFFESAGALGTLGITTQLEVQLVECGQYIEVTYTPVTSHAQTLKLFADVGEDIAFTDAIVFSSCHGVTADSRLCDLRERETRGSLPMCTGK
jgi:delta24-sterol reductase